MSFDTFLTESGLPQTGQLANSEEYWCGLDNFENYRKRGGHPLYGERDIVYRYNSLGYRCPEFDQDADIRIISIGCSWTLGVGLPQPESFSEIFAQRLRREAGRTVINWNLAFSGTSCDYVSRMLHLAVPRLNPDIILILFPQLARREYVAVQGRIVHYGPNYVTRDPVAREICGHFSALSSPHDDLMNFYRNYKSVESLLVNRCWFFSFTGLGETMPAMKYIDHTHYAKAQPIIDRARDAGHPGRQTHQRICDEFWTQFVATGGLGQLVHQRQ